MAEGFLASDGQGLDIADEFSYLSRSLGFERGVPFAYALPAGF